MFTFKPKTQPAPDDNTERLDSIAKQLADIGYRQEDLQRTLRRIETKLVRLGIAAGYPDAVSRGQS